MKRLLLLLALGFLGAAAPRQGSAAEVTVDVFYNQLEPYGDWIDAGEYGYAWHPRDVAEDWRPYTDGRWAYTDAGWTWVSEEPYSWAVYHYGRWAQVADVGWLWVPGTEWGPAWVSFRRSKRHIGWAPLPPEARLTREVRTISTWSDAYYDVGPTQYTFVEARNFGSRHLRESVLPPRENVTIIRETTNITNIRVEHNVIYNGGPEYAVVTRESAQPIERLRIERRSDFVESDRDSYRTEVQGGAVRFAAPIFAAAVAASFTPAKVSRKLEKVEVNRGWKDVADPAAAQELRTKIRSEAKTPRTLPPAPKFEKASLLAAPLATPAAAPATTAGPEKTAPASGEKTAPMPAEKTPATSAAPEARPAAPTTATPADAASPPEKMEKKKPAGDGPAPALKKTPADPQPTTKPEEPAPAPAGKATTPKAPPTAEKPEAATPAKPHGKTPKEPAAAEPATPPPAPKKTPRTEPKTPAEPAASNPPKRPAGVSAPPAHKGKKPDATEPPARPQPKASAPETAPADPARNHQGKGQDPAAAPAQLREKAAIPERPPVPPTAPPAPKKREQPPAAPENPRGEPAPRNAAPNRAAPAEKAPAEKEKKNDRKNDSPEKIPQ